MTSGSFAARLARCIQDAVAELGGYRQLQEDFKLILKKNQPPLTRRQIGKICNGEDLPLKGKQLEELNEYLQLRRNTSISALWSNNSVLRDVAASKSVAFVVGSQPDKAARRIDLSRWDVRAMREVLNQLNALGQPLDIFFEDVIYRGRQAKMFDSPPVPENEAWYHLLNQEMGPSIIGLGSPKANHCAELMFSRIFGVRAFEPWPEQQPRPFAFVWPSGDVRADKIDSCVRLDPINDAKTIATFKGCTTKTLRALQNERHQTLAVVIDDELFEVCRKKNQWYTYSIVAAWRPAKRMHVCIAGLTGPATLGAAKLLPQLTPQLQLGSPACSAAWMVVRTHVTEEKEGDYRSDERRAGESVVLGDIRYVRSSDQ